MLRNQRASRHFQRRVGHWRPTPLVPATKLIASLPIAPLAAILRRPGSCGPPSAVSRWAGHRPAADGHLGHPVAVEVAHRGCRWQSPFRIPTAHSLWPAHTPVGTPGPGCASRRTWACPTSSTNRNCRLAPMAGADRGPADTGHRHRRWQYGALARPGIRARDQCGLVGMRAHHGRVDGWRRCCGQQQRDQRSKQAGHGNARRDRVAAQRQAHGRYYILYEPRPLGSGPYTIRAASPKVLADEGPRS